MDYIIHTPSQLGQALKGQRKSKRLTQKSAGAAVGLLPKTISVLESSPQKCSVESLFKLLSILELEVVLRPKTTTDGRSPTVEW